MGDGSLKWGSKKLWRLQKSVTNFDSLQGCLERVLEETVLKFKLQWITQDVGGAMTVRYLQRKYGVEQGPRKATCIPGTRGLGLQEPWWHHTLQVFDRVARLGVFPVGFLVCFGQIFLYYLPIHPFLIRMLTLWHWILEEYNLLVYIFPECSIMKWFWIPEETFGSEWYWSCLLRLWEFWS